MRVLKLYCTNETPMSPADLADDADEPQNQDYKIATITRTTNCLYLRNNAALLHSSALSALSAREQTVYVDALKLWENIVEAIAFYLRESARDNAVYVDKLYLRENTSALADMRKRNSAGAQCVFYMLAAIS